MIVGGFDVSTKGIAYVVLGSADPETDGPLSELHFGWWAMPKGKGLELRPSLVLEQFQLPTFWGQSVKPCYIEQPMSTQFRGTTEVDIVIGGLICALGGWRCHLTNISSWKSSAGVFDVLKAMRHGAKLAGEQLPKDAHKIAISKRAMQLFPQLHGERQDVLDAACIAYAGWLWAGGIPL